jgi:serine/threonine protein kinase
MSFHVPSNESVKESLKIYSDISFYKKGGFKAVYKGIKEEIIEAVKLNYIPDISEPGITEEIVEQYRKRINREINILSKCSSPYIVRLGGLSLKEIKIESNNYAVYSEEFLDGETLFDIVKQGFQPNEKELKLLAQSMLVAINELWEINQSIHRDIKTLNIKKTNIPERQFVLFDLGIAFSRTETPITINPFQVPGTRQNLAPEMFDPNFRNSIDFRSDLYTLGITLYEYATGKHPLAEPGEDVMITISKILRETPISIKTLRSDLSENFANLIDQWLKKKPHLRPSNLGYISKILGE